MKKYLKIFLTFIIILSMGLCFSTPSYATDITPVDKVNVEFRYFVAEPINPTTAIPADGGGYWQLAETYTATAGGSNGKKLEMASNTASWYSPTLLGNVEYTFNNSWVDDFGNTYGTSGRLVGQDFINMFSGFEGPTQTLEVYAQYTADYRYMFYNNEIDNIANGSHSESHIVDSKTSYHYTFTTPADIPDKYDFLYWDSGDYGVFYSGSEFIITNQNLGSDTTMNFVATYEYTPTSLVKVIYQTSEGIIYETDPSDQPINIRENAPELKNGQWLFNTCPCINDIVYPENATPIITTVPIKDEPIITVYTIYGVLNGNDGKNGIDGIDGKDGLDGKDGINGIDGKDGINGTNGIDGKDGENGKSAYELAVLQGFQGTLDEWLESLIGKSGLDGKDGIDGLNGKDGVDGKDGIDGKNGVDGKSAYDLAVEQGFNGTIEEWLKSLIGKDGLDGKDGKNGIDGKNGADGKDGLNGIDGKDGAQGEKGDPGKDGINGASAYELAIKEGFSGTLDEWLESLVGKAGKDGIDGINGENGKDGLDGAKGDKGDSGKDGVKGASAYEIAVENGYTGTVTEWLRSLVGPTGPQGEQGIQGIQGEQGIQGIQGAQGIQGLRGIQGVPGTPGARGPQGIQGIQGVAGKDGLNGKDGTDGKDGISASYSSVDETILDDETPLSRGGVVYVNNSHWGFLNLVFMLLSIITFVIPMILTKKNSTPNYIKIIISIFTALSILIFVLTEYITSPMWLIDPWTWLMALICICDVLLVCLYYFTKKEKQEEKEINN